MACEDFPCCDHEAGCCPDFDASGNQLNMRCVCGAVLPITSRVSLCDSCLMDHQTEDEDWGDDEDSPYEDEDYDGQPDEAQEWYDFNPDC